MTTRSMKLESTAQDVGLHETVLAAEAMSSLLRPLARLMIDHGLHLPATVELLKSALVQEAQSAYALEQKASTDTRIAILTGVHRKDVRRLRNAPSVAKAPDTMLPLAASVVARRISEPRYLDADQKPLPLARTPGRGSAGEPDFTALPQKSAVTWVPELCWTNWNGWGWWRSARMGLWPCGHRNLCHAMAAMSRFIFWLPT